MSNSKLILSAVSLMALFGAPMMAMASDVDLRLSGAAQKDTGHYLVREGDRVSLGAWSAPGEQVWIVAAHVRKDGSVDWAHGTTLLASKTGFCEGKIVVPKGNAGESFALLAFAMDAKGEMSHSGMLRVDVQD